MNNHPGQLRYEQDATLRLRLDTQKHILSFGEYAPFVVLIILLLCLLINGMVG